MKEVLALTCLAVVAACGDVEPTAPALEAAFLLGGSPLQPITLDTSGENPLLKVPLTVNRGIAQVSIEDKFFIRGSGEFKLVAGGTVGSFGPQDFSLSGQKDTGVRDGSDVGFIMDIDIPAPVWLAIKDLDQVAVQVLAELVLTTGSGAEKVLDFVSMGIIMDIN